MEDQKNGVGEGRRDIKLYSQNRHHLEMPFRHRSEAGEGVSHANI